MRSKSLPILLAFVAVLCLAPAASAQEDMADRHGVSAAPFYSTFTQPNGVTFTARKFGDERYHFMETKQGFSLRLNEKTDFYEFVRVNGNGEFVFTGIKAGIHEPKAYGLSKKNRESAAVINRALASGPGAPSSAPSGNPVPLSAFGTVKKLVVLANFSDTAFTYSQNVFDGLFNSPGYSDYGSKGSVWDYYHDVSSGILTVETTVSVIVNLPHAASYYGRNRGQSDARPREMVADALDALDAAGFDFAPFDTNNDGYIDALAVIHQGPGEEAGGGANTIWSHKWALKAPKLLDGVYAYLYYTAPETLYDGLSTIGVYAHEFGHSLGLPDLYDTDYSSAGIGDWGIMASGSWNDMGRKPADFIGWSKIDLGWIIPTILDSDTTAVQLSTTLATGTVYKLTTGMASNEYLLLENRLQSGWDSYIPGSGLLISHIDDSQSSNSNESRYHVGVLQADGNQDLENDRNQGDSGDLFPGSSSNRALSPDSSPNSNSYYNGDTGIFVENISDASATMTFDVRFVDPGGTEPPPPTGDSAPVAVSITRPNSRGSGGLFSTVFSDADGAADIATTYLVFGDLNSPASSVWIYADVATNTLYLLDDSGNPTLSGQMGSAGVLSNGRASINLASANFAASGDSLTFDVVVTFNTSTFKGRKKTYVKADDNSGLTTDWVGAGNYQIK